MTRARKKLPYEGTGVSVSTSLAELQKILTEPKREVAARIERASSRTRKNRRTRR